MSSSTGTRYISKRAAAQQRQQRVAVATGSSAVEASPSSSPLGSMDLAVVGVAIVTIAVTASRLYKLMHVRINAEKIAVVYDARRRTLFSTPMDHCGTLREALAFVRSPKGKASLGVSGRFGGAFTSLVGLRLLLGAAIFPSCAAYVTRPPLPWYKVFELPRSVLNREEGVELLCRITDVPTRDGTAVEVEVRIHFFIDLNNDLERYLSLCGPIGPHDYVGKAVGYCVRSHAATVDAGIIVSPQRREKYFMESFSSHVVSKLLADCAIRVINVRIDRASEVSH